MQRRDFLKKGCIACFALASGSILLDSCQPLPILKIGSEDKLMKIDKDVFTEKVTMLIVRTPSLDNDILLVKNPDLSYTALLMQCTHQDNPLVASTKELYCSTHGSRFALNGKVTAGPAIRNLFTFKTSSEGNSVIIHLN